MWQALQASLLRQRLVVFVRNASAAAVLFVGADAVAQYMENHHKNNNNRHKDGNDNTNDRAPFVLDQRRSTGAMALGVILGGAVYPTAYAQLDALLPGQSWRVILLKSAVEIVTVGILVNTASLCGRCWWWQRGGGGGGTTTHTWTTVQQHVWTEIPRVTAMDARVWFPYNVLAFGWIPIHVRPLTTVCMEAGWQTYISLRAHDCHPVV